MFSSQRSKSSSQSLIKSPNPFEASKPPIKSTRSESLHLSHGCLANLQESDQMTSGFQSHMFSLSLQHLNPNPPHPAVKRPLTLQAFLSQHLLRQSPIGPPRSLTVMERTNTTSILVMAASSPAGPRKQTGCHMKTCTHTSLPFSTIATPPLTPSSLPKISM